MITLELSTCAYNGILAGQRLHLVFLSHLIELRSPIDRRARNGIKAMATHGSNIDGMTGEEAYWTGYWNRIFLAIREEATGMTAAEIERREVAAKARYDQTSDDEDYHRWQEWYGISYVMQDDGMDCYDPAKDGRPL